MFKRSLRLRLVFSYLVIITLTTIGFTLLVNRVITNRFRQMVEDAGQWRIERNMPAMVDYYSQNASWQGIEEVLDRTHRDIGSMAAAPLSADERPDGGRKPGDYPFSRLIEGNRMQAAEDRMLLFDAQDVLVYDSEPDGIAVGELPVDLEKGEPVAVNGEIVGTVLVASSFGVYNRFQSMFLYEVNLWMAGAALLAIVVVATVGLIQARRIVSPVQALEKAARRVAGGDLNQRIPVTSQDELGDMAQAFNTMAEDLEKQRELRHRTTADVAHELRTPLSVLQIELESMEDGITEATPEALADLQTEVNYLSGLVEDLRMLSLVDAGELTIDLQRVDLNDLAQIVVNRLKEAARDAEITLEAKPADQPVWVMGDDQRLIQVMFNLLTNAMRHTPFGGLVSVSVTGEEGEAQVVVEDNGEGIPEADLPFIFERMYRINRARSRDSGGSGLGLSIARGFVEAHGGSIRAESVVGEGSRFIFRLPVVDQA